MRKNGVNLPDPTVDANGNLTLRPPGGFGGGEGLGRQGGSTSTTIAGSSTNSSGSSTTPQDTQRAQRDAARKVCGNPPQGAFGGFNRLNSQAFQDAALKFAQCMRKNGVNVPDPQFGAGTGSDSGRTQTGPSSGSNSGRLRGFLGGLDRNDPSVQKAMQACESIIRNARNAATSAPGAGG
jgi:hypothetical protein